MRYFLENEIIKVEIETLGAELQSVYNKETQLEYLWNGDSNFWGKKSPVLFPIVGGLKNNEYEFEGKMYNLSRHGFAREKEFLVEQQSDNLIQFILNYSDDTLLKYPFKFKFIVEYTIEKNLIFCKYIVENFDNKTMFFSVGAHPAFSIPLTKNSNFDDWFLSFNKNENCGIYPLSKDGLIEMKSLPLLQNQNKINLTKKLFYNDALVFKELTSTQISILSNISPHGLSMNFEGFSFYGIWSAKDANFICLEPWCGIADNANTTKKLEEKEGIIALDKQQIFNATWSVSFF